MPPNIDTKFLPASVEPTFLPILPKSTPLINQRQAARCLGISIEQFSLGRQIDIFKPEGVVLRWSGQWDRRFDEQKLLVASERFTDTPDDNRVRALIHSLYPSGLYPLFSISQDFEDDQIVIWFNDVVYKYSFEDESTSLMSKFKKMLGHATGETVVSRPGPAPSPHPVKYKILAPASVGVSECDVREILGLSAATLGVLTGSGDLCPINLCEVPLGITHRYYDPESVADLLQDRSA